MFPPTRHSVVRAVGAADPGVRREAFERLVAGYWRPVYKYLRHRWRLQPADAEDATQAFFAAALAKDWFSPFDPGRAKFRTFLRTLLDGFAANEHKAAHRLKRGGGHELVPLDFPDAERELTRQGPVDADPEAYFHREWIRALFGAAVDDLRRRYAASGRGVRYELFTRYDLDPLESDTRPSYRDLAAEHGLSITDVTNELAAARRDFRAAVIERLRASCGSDAEARAEARELFGPRTS